jgi:glyceraldehyde-3-phosphate dehydrogenase (NADP+)
VRGRRRDHALQLPGAPRDTQDRPRARSGNAVVLKPARQTPLTALFLTARPPRGRDCRRTAIQCVTGRAAELGDASAPTRACRKISFTGSTDVGEQITRVAGVKRLSLELGSNCPLIVLPDARSRSGRGRPTATGGYVNAGQVCISVQRVLVADEVYGDFVERLQPAVEGCAPASARRRTTLGPVISKPRRSGSSERSARPSTAVRRCCTAASATGRRRADDRRRRRPGMELSRPSSSGRRSRSPGLGIDAGRSQLANDSDYGLGAGLFTSQIDCRAPLRRAKVDCGSIQINSSPLWRADLMPYGG